jgi:hypothetical protein
MFHPHLRTHTHGYCFSQHLAHARRLDRWTLTLLGAPVLIVRVTYWGYCWGWWGRNTLVHADE